MSSEIPSRVPLIIKKPIISFLKLCKISLLETEFLGVRISSHGELGVNSPTMGRS